MSKISPLITRAFVVIAFFLLAPSFGYTDFKLFGAAYDQLSPRIAFNEIDNQYLTVWQNLQRNSVIEINTAIVRERAALASDQRL